MKKYACMILLAGLVLALTGCGEKPAAAVANPWREVTEAEAKALCPVSFVPPAGAVNASWRVLDAAADPSGLPGPLVQLSFELDGLSFTARAQHSGSKSLDSSGMYYTWTVEEEISLCWGDDALPCRYRRFIGETGCADLCLWYDAASGVSYSLSTAAADLDGYDLPAVAEAMAPPAAP